VQHKGVLVPTMRPDPGLHGGGCPTIFEIHLLG
jgi:hypothetical protein